MCPCLLALVTIPPKSPKYIFYVVTSCSNYRFYVFLFFLQHQRLPDRRALCGQVMSIPKIETFHAITPCQSEACQAIYGYYEKTYSEFIEEREQRRILSEEKDAIGREHVRETKLLKSQIADLEFYLARVTAVADALQKETEPVKETCSQCVRWFKGLEQQRFYNAGPCGIETITKRYKDLLQDLKVAQEEAKDERVKIGRLNVHLQQINNPLATNREIQALKDKEKILRHEMEGVRRAVDAATKEKELYERKWNDTKERADATEGLLSEARLTIQKLESRLDVYQQITGRSPPAPNHLENENQQLKRKIEELEALVVPTLDAFVLDKLKCVFSILDTQDTEVVENELYDAFVNSIPLNEHEQYLGSMYEFCNPGKSLPLRERQEIKQGGKRVCKSSFSKCLEAIGGVIKMAGTQKIWTNVSIVAPKVRRTG